MSIRRPSDGVEYFDTETFSTKAFAKAWLKKEEDRLEKNPELLSTDRVSSAMTLGTAIKKYLDEVVSFGRSKRMGLRFLVVFQKVCWH